MSNFSPLLSFSSPLLPLLPGSNSKWVFVFIETIFMRNVCDNRTVVSCCPFSSWPASTTWHSLLEAWSSDWRTQLEPDFPTMLLVLFLSFLQDYSWFSFFFLTCFLPQHFLSPRFFAASTVFMNSFTFLSLETFLALRTHTCLSLVLCISYRAGLYVARFSSL